MNGWERRTLAVAVIAAVLIPAGFLAIAALARAGGNSCSRTAAPPAAVFGRLPAGARVDVQEVLLAEGCGDADKRNVILTANTPASSSSLLSDLANALERGGWTIDRSQPPTVHAFSKTRHASAWILTAEAEGAVAPPPPQRTPEQATAEKQKAMDAANQGQPIEGSGSDPQWIAVEAAVRQRLDRLVAAHTPAVVIRLEPCDGGTDC